jgi:hypothetical protein
VTPETVGFEGHTCVRVSGGASELLVTVSTGPRIIGCLVDGENLFAVLPDATLDSTDGERFRLLGGHRLWAAPEVPAVTYRPDDRPCEAMEVEGGIRVEAPQDGAGLVKAIEVRPDDGDWVVGHELANGTDGTITVAPWAITMMRPGGEAVLAMRSRGSDPRADRSLVLWPYTDLGDPRIRVGPDEVRVLAEPDHPPTKVGVASSDGEVSYRTGAYVFEKRIDVDPDAAYADRGAAVQVYVGGRCCELETLGPLRALASGEHAGHRERWTFATESSGGTGTGSSSSTASANRAAWISY